MWKSISFYFFSVNDGESQPCLLDAGIGISGRRLPNAEPAQFSSFDLPPQVVAFFHDGQELV
jgi:hypothetical protein